MHYDRPGPGVRKDEKPKKAVPRFFIITGRKFFDLIKLNLLFAIPVAIAFALVYLVGSVTQMSFVADLPILLIAPFVAGLTLVTRNYAREEHAFIYWDFKDAVKNNWKSFLINGVVCYAFYFILSIAIRYYSAMSKTNNLFLVAMVVCIAIAILFIFAQYYVSIMLVTFDLTLRQVYKNALIFSIIGLWKNLLLTVLLALIIFLLYISQVMVLTMIISVLLILCFLFAFCMLLINFTVYPLIDKMMIKPYEKQLKEGTDGEEAEEEEEQPSSFKDGEA